MDNCTGERKIPDFLRTITSEFQIIPILGNLKCYYVPLITMVRTELSKPLKLSPTTLSAVYIVNQKQHLVLGRTAEISTTIKDIKTEEWWSLITSPFYTYNDPAEKKTDDGSL